MYKKPLNHSTNIMRSCLSMTTRFLNRTLTNISKAPISSPKLTQNMSSTYQIPDHALLGLASHLPSPKRTPTLSISPIILHTPNRPPQFPIHIRITVPTIGSSLPIILLSHGQGSSNNLSSLNGYGPLVDYYASHGFAVIQPTHLSSNTLSLGAKLASTAPDTDTDRDAKPPGSRSQEAEDLAKILDFEHLGPPPLFWKSRIHDFTDILDAQSTIEADFSSSSSSSPSPSLSTRLDWTRIAIVGHSMGGHTASMLLGASYLNPNNSDSTFPPTTPTKQSFHDPRIKAGILIGAPGCDPPNGETQTARARAMAPFFAYTDFSTMVTPALIVHGELDVPDYLTTRGVEWHMDPYVFAGGSKDLLIVKGAWHIFGGISGWDVKETGEDESVERVGVVCRMTGGVVGE